VDQASSMMIYLGDPFFYHHNPEFISCNESRQVHIQGSQICKLIKNPNHWLDDAHITLIICWMLRDYGHPLLDQFTYIPFEISTVFHNFVNKSVPMKTLARTLHQFCKEDYQKIYKQFVVVFFRTKEILIGLCMWQSIHLLPLINCFFQKKLPNFDMVAISPMTHLTMPMWIGVKNEHGCYRPLLFRLNVMSYYRDLDIHGLMDESKPLLEYNDLWAIGARGPFGCYLPP
jgi:hypothetical protein